MPKRECKPDPPNFIEKLKVWHSHEADCNCDICQEINAWYS